MNFNPEPYLEEHNNLNSLLNENHSKPVLVESVNQDDLDSVLCYFESAKRTAGGSIQTVLLSTSTL